MQERRAALRFQTNLNARWETLRSQGRGAICDLCSLGCFVLSGAEVQPGELVRLEVFSAEEVISIWGHVIYSIHEIGFALRFYGYKDKHPLDKLIASLG